MMMMIIVIIIDIVIVINKQVGFQRAMKQRFSRASGL